MKRLAGDSRLGISFNRLNEIVLGKRRITADTALHLPRLFGMSPQFWMRLPDLAARFGPDASDRFRMDIQTDTA